MRIWWLSPAAAFTAATAPLALLAYWLPASLYANYWKTPKHFGAEHIALTLMTLAAFTLGSLLTSRRIECPDRRLEADPANSHINWQLIRVLFSVSFYLSIVGYIAWTATAISQGLTLQTIVELFTNAQSSAAEIKEEYLGTTPGLTTLTQFGIASMVLGCVLGHVHGWSKVRARLLLLVGLAALRAFIHSERLALLELVVPVLVLFLVFRFVNGGRRSAMARFGIIGFPVLAGVIVFVFFTGLEYYRSWSFYAKREDSLLGFGFFRLLGYYTTALNNGAYLFNRLEVPLSVPVFTLDWLWHFPILKELIGKTDIPLFRDNFWAGLLRAGVNPEYNNPDGILVPYLDFGIFGGLVFWLVMGMIGGVTYRLFVQKHLFGLFIYPVFYVGLIEATRILYWVGGRVFPSWCLLLLGVLLVVTYQTKSWDEAHYPLTE